MSDFPIKIVTIPDVPPGEMWLGCRRRGIETPRSESDLKLGYVKAVNVHNPEPRLVPVPRDLMALMM